MNITVKKFNELTIDELYDILRVRTDVFVVEQECPYPEVDGKDQHSIHVMLYDNDDLKAYCRVIEPGIQFDQAAIGRVLTTERGKGYSTPLIEKAIEIARDDYKSEKAIIEAQVYAMKMYEKFGWYATGEEFLEDGIPHIQMTLDL